MDGGYGDHGGASEFAGGGFMPQASQGAGSAFSPSAGGRKVSSSVVVPFTIRHLANSHGATGGDVLTLNGQEVNNVVLVGKVVTMESRSTDLTFVLDDGTGKLEVRKWHDDQAHEREQIANIRSGIYLKVHGVPRKIGSKQTLSANSIRPITDFNEVTCHFLDCIFAYQYSKGQGGGPVQNLDQTSLGQGFGHQPEAKGPVSSGAGLDSAGDARLPLHERVLKFFAANETSDPAGVHRDLVARSIPGATPQQILETIDFLVTEGHLYSTIDDVHFKTLGENQ